MSSTEKKTFQFNPCLNEANGVAAKAINEVFEASQDKKNKGLYVTITEEVAMSSVKSWMVYSFVLPNTKAEATKLNWPNIKDLPTDDETGEQLENPYILFDQGDYSTDEKRKMTLKWANAWLKHMGTGPRHDWIRDTVYPNYNQVLRDINDGKYPQYGELTRYVKSRWQKTRDQRKAIDASEKSAKGTNPKKRRAATDVVPTAPTATTAPKKKKPRKETPSKTTALPMHPSVKDYTDMEQFIKDHPSIQRACPTECEAIMQVLKSKAFDALLAERKQKQ